MELSWKDILLTVIGAFALAFIITQYIFPIGKEESVEDDNKRPYHEDYPAYIREVTFEGNVIKHMVINNEMLNSENTVFKIEPIASDDKTNRTYYISGISSSIIYYKNGYEDFIKDYGGK